MSTKTVRVCDGCGKGEERANHWFQARYDLSLLIRRDKINIDNEEDVKDYCGEACLLKAVSDWASQQV